MKQKEIIALALAGVPNAEISSIVGTRPRRIREIVSAAIRSGVPIAPNAERMVSRGGRDEQRSPFPIFP